MKNRSSVVILTYQNQKLEKGKRPQKNHVNPRYWQCSIGMSWYLFDISKSELSKNILSKKREWCEKSCLLICSTSQKQMTNCQVIYNTYLLLYNVICTICRTNHWMKVVSALFANTSESFCEDNWIFVFRSNCWIVRVWFLLHKDQYKKNLTVTCSVISRIKNTTWYLHYVKRRNYSDHTVHYFR